MSDAETRAIQFTPAQRDMVISALAYYETLIEDKIDNREPGARREMNVLQRTFAAITDGGQREACPTCGSTDRDVTQGPQCLFDGGYDRWHGAIVAGVEERVNE